MSSDRVHHFNRVASKPGSRSEQAIKILDLKEGQFVADLGSGGGYFTLRFAKAVGRKGKVYAIDINREFLDFIRSEMTKENLKNVEFFLAREDGVDLPEETFDIIFIRNMLHHMKNRTRYLNALKPLLKENGKLVIIDYDGSSIFSWNFWSGHYIKPEVLRTEVKKAGYVKENEYDFISGESFMVFGKN